VSPIAKWGTFRWREVVDPRGISLIPDQRSEAHARELYYASRLVRTPSFPLAFLETAVKGFTLLYISNRFFFLNLLPPRLATQRNRFLSVY